MPAPTMTSSSRPTPPWRPHNRNSPPQQGKGGNAAAAMTPACPKPTKNQSYAEPVQLSRPEYPSQSPTHHADTQISPITLKSSASKTPREKSGTVWVDPSSTGVTRRRGALRSPGRSCGRADWARSHGSGGCRWRSAPAAGLQPGMDPRCAVAPLALLEDLPDLGPEPATPGSTLSSLWGRTPPGVEPAMSNPQDPAHEPDGVL